MSNFDGDQSTFLALESEADSEDLVHKKSNEPHIFSISELNGEIQKILEGEFSYVWAKGEISNFIAHTSGHFYFSLKDSGGQISAVMFKGLNSKLKFKPENGMEVIVRGKITVYKPRGNYQFFCEMMEPVGAGALQKAFEQLKAKLQKEGLFEASRKRAIPNFPKHIGLVTSPTGAAIQDILNILSRRYKAAKITLVPALVQGDTAPQSIVKAIQLANQVQDFDVLIIGRGGGSAEDLWAFNDERVARAIAASRIPTISAVGHEVDFTIADFVADLRAPTPSAAAELVVKNVSEVLELIQNFKIRLWQNFKNQSQARAEKVLSLSKRLVDPQRKLQDLQIRCDELNSRLESGMFRYLDAQRLNVQLAYKKLGSPREYILRLQKKLQLSQVRLQNLIQVFIEKKLSRLKFNAGRLNAMSPLGVVERGYSIVEKVVGKKAKKIVTRVGDLSSGNMVSLRFSDGEATAEIKTTNIMD